MHNNTVLLISPHYSDHYAPKIVYPPLALLYLGAHLKGHGIGAQILDFNVFKPWGYNFENLDAFYKQHLYAAIEHHSPFLVGISCIFAGNLPVIRIFIDLIKHCYPTMPIVLGGGHPSMYPKKLLENIPGIDFIVIEEGEQQLFSLSEFLLDPDNNSLDHIDGLAYRKNDQVIVNPKKKYIDDLDILRFPDYGMVNLNEYDQDTSEWFNPKQLTIRNPLPLLTSRGCPMDCSFCTMKQIAGKGFRVRSPVNVVDEIQSLYDNYGVNYFAVYDDNMTLNRDRVLKICDEIVSRRLHIQMDVMNVMLKTMDHEMIDALVAAGMVRVGLPIESGSDYIRNQILGKGKNFTKEKVFALIEHLRKYPVFIKAFFMIGFPEETNETLTDTYNMLVAMDVDHPLIYNLTPVPGTRIFKQCLRDSLFVDNITEEDVWKNDQLFTHIFYDKDLFFIKPYAMKIEDLVLWRNKFDSLVEQKIATNIRNRYDNRGRRNNSD